MSIARSPPGQEKLVDTLKNAEKRLLSYTELRDKTGLSDPALSEYLKDLQNKGLIHRDPTSRKYGINERGEKSFVGKETLSKFKGLLEDRFTPNSISIFAVGPERHIRKIHFLWRESYGEIEEIWEGLKTEAKKHTER